jgi:hypothetical protein
LRPDQCPVFVRNELVVPAPPAVVWERLVRAADWPHWFARATSVRFERGGPVLAVGTIVVWRMLGATIRVEVRRADPPAELDWEGGAWGVHAYHAWKLVPAADGATRVITEETERGSLPWLLRWYLRGALHGAHRAWLEDLARTVRPGGAGLA